MFNSSIPNDWALARIENVAEVKGGKRLPKGRALSDEKTNFPYIRVTDFNNGGIDASNLKYLDAETQNSIKQYTISSEDLYISIAGTIGLVGEIPDFLSGANLTENAAKLCNLSGVYKSYLRYVLNSNGAIEQFEDKMTSSGQPKLALFRIKDCSFPLPPLAEQKVIAEKLDTLLAQVDNTKARLERIPEILKRFRQSVLAAAVSGKLTEGWRIARNKEIFPSITWEGILRDKKDSFKRGPFGSALKKSMFVSSGYKVYEQYCPINDDCSYVRYYISPEQFEQMKAFEVKAGDFLISCSGVSLGRITQVPEGCEPGIINQALLRVRLNNNLYSDQYFKLVFRSPPFQKAIFDNSTGSAIPNLKGTKELKAMLLPLPSLEEQAEIVHRVEELFAFADRIEQAAQAALSRVNNLTQSILAKAFRGELTADWRAANPELISGEHSAEALLARIKAERAKLKPTKKVKAG